jgi:hypothetical protein
VKGLAWIGLDGIALFCFVLHSNHREAMVPDEFNGMEWNGMHWIRFDASGLPEFGNGRVAAVSLNNSIVPFAERPCWRWRASW